MLSNIVIDFPEGSYLSNFFLTILSENFPPRPNAAKQQISGGY
jgi:hypothetical protein